MACTREQGWRCGALIDRHGIEVARAARILVSEVCGVRPDESWVLTADDGSDAGVVMATAVAAYAAGACPLIVWDQSHGARSEATARAVSGADMWIDLCVRQSGSARRKGGRHLCLRGLSATAVRRLLGRVDIEALGELGAGLGSIISQAESVRVTSPAGCDARFECRAEPPRAPADCELAGLIRWGAVSSTLTGVIVVDGSLSGSGVVSGPVRIEADRGRLVSCSGGKEAQWLACKLKQAAARSTVTWVSAGFNPGASLSGMRIEDERVWGCIGWQIGCGGDDGTVGVSLDCSMWIDGRLFMDRGRIVYPGLEELARRSLRQ